MDNERHNERMEWVRRLEEPGALWEAGLTDKEATWDKLYERLRETPRRRPLPWLWAAAACLLLVVIPAAFFLKEKGHNPGPGPVAVRPGTSPATAPHVTDRGQSPTDTHATDRVSPSADLSHPRTSIPDLAPSLVIKNTPPPASTASVNPPHPGRREKAARTKDGDHTAAPVAAMTPGRSMMPAGPAITSVHPSVTSVRPSITPARPAIPLTVSFARPDLSKPIATITAQTTPKRELRVVHINELESRPPAPAVAGARQRSGRLVFTFRQSQEQETLRPATTYQTYQTDHPIISFKHSTPNP